MPTKQTIWWQPRSSATIIVATAMNSVVAAHSALHCCCWCDTWWCVHCTTVWQGTELGTFPANELLHVIGKSTVHGSNSVPIIVGDGAGQQHYVL
jgi:hypothetical protein